MAAHIGQLLECCRLTVSCELANNPKRGTGQAVSGWDPASRNRGGNTNAANPNSAGQDRRLLGRLILENSRVTRSTYSKQHAEE